MQSLTIGWHSNSRIGHLICLTSFFYYNDYDSMEEESRNMLRKSMAAFGGIAPTYHIELLDRPTIYWDFHSLLLGIQMMFSFMLVDDAQSRCGCASSVRKCS